MENPENKFDELKKSLDDIALRIQEVKKSCIANRERAIRLLNETNKQLNQLENK